jgi:hypothetical protein
MRHSAISGGSRLCHRSLWAWTHWTRLVLSVHIAVTVPSRKSPPTPATQLLSNTSPLPIKLDLGSNNTNIIINNFPRNLQKELKVVAFQLTNLYFIDFLTEELTLLYVQKLTYFVHHFVDLFIIILINYNSSQFTIVCLHHLPEGLALLVI